MRTDYYGVMFYSEEKGWLIYSKEFSTKRKATEFVLNYRIKYGATHYRIMAMTIENQDTLSD